MALEELQIQRINHCEMNKQNIALHDVHVQAVNDAVINLWQKEPFCFSRVLVAPALRLNAKINKDRLHQGLKKKSHMVKAKSPRASIVTSNAIAPILPQLDYQLRKNLLARNLSTYFRQSNESNKSKYWLSANIASICYTMEFKYKSALLAKNFHSSKRLSISTHTKVRQVMASSIASTAFRMEYLLKRAILFRSMKRLSLHIPTTKNSHPEVSNVIAPICHIMEYKYKKSILGKLLRQKFTCGIEINQTQVARSIAPAVSRLEYLMKRALLYKAMKTMQSDERSGSRVHGTIRSGVNRIERLMTRDALRQSLDRRPTREQIEETGVLNSITRGG